MKDFKAVDEEKPGSCRGCCFDGGIAACKHPDYEVVGAICKQNQTIFKFTKDIKQKPMNIAKLKNLIKFGNMKLPKTTMTFNMGSSKNCPSRELGLCSYASICYARQPERMYPQALPYRERQQEYWLNTNKVTVCKDLSKIIKRKRIKPTLFRFNESGDFHSQECIEKLDFIAEYLLEYFGIVTYGYTSRKDLNFDNASFIVKGSDNDSGNHGKTVAIGKNSGVANGFMVCPGDCKICSMCSAEKPFNIAFIKH